MNYVPGLSYVIAKRDTANGRPGEAEGRPTWDMTMKYAAIGKWRMPVRRAECQARLAMWGFTVRLSMVILVEKMGVCLISKSQGTWQIR